MYSGQMYHVYQNQASAAYSSLYFFIFFPLQFSTLKYFVTLFSGNCEAQKIETWYTRGQWADVSCLQESGCCCLFVPLFLHFSFSPNFNIEIFVTLFSGTMRPGRLKISTHVDGGQIYHVYQNQAAAAYSSHYFFIFLSLQFSTLKFFITFLRNCEAQKIETWYTHRQWADVSCILESGCCCLFIPLFLHFPFSPIFNIEIFHYSFLGNYEAQKIETRGIKN